MTIESYAREVYADAYALHGPFPMSQRSRALGRAAVDLAKEHAEDLHALSMVAEIAKAEGIKAALEERREKISKRYARKAKAVPRAIAASFPVGEFVDQASEPEHGDNDMSEKPDPKRRQMTAAAKAVALVALRAWLTEHPDEHEEWTELVSIAEAEATAEGIVQGTALSEPQSVTIDLDELYDETIKNLRQLDTYGDKAPEWITQQLDGLAGDMGKAIADGIARDFGRQDLIDLVGQVIGKGDGVEGYIDEAIHFSMQQAAVSQMIALGVDLFDYMTQPDSCDICAPLDSSIAGPYTAEALPIPPMHISCRCLVGPAGSS